MKGKSETRISKLETNSNNFVPGVDIGLLKDVVPLSPAITTPISSSRPGFSETLLDFFRTSV